jgi:hypothetical protein
VIILLALVPVITVTPKVDGRQIEKVAFVDYGKKPNSNSVRNIDLCGDGANKFTYLAGKIRWPELPVPYYVDTSGLVSDSLTHEQAEEAVVAAFDTWDLADRPNRQFFTQVFDVSDASITVSWQPLDGSFDVIASVAVFYTIETKEILLSSIVLDSEDNWFIGEETDKCENVGSAFDIQNVVTHEAGHVVGLGHVSHPALTMYPYVSPGELNKRSLGLGDRNGFNKVQ